MPTFYNYRENGVNYSFDDVFVPVDSFRQGNLLNTGFNLQGQMGDNTTTSKLTPVTTFTGASNWKQVSCGGYYTSAIKTDGTLWTWGRNTNGPLGNNTVSQSITPITTFAGGNNWIRIDCGNEHMAAIKTDGTLWIWGSNLNGQLGTNNTVSRSTPVTTFAGGTNWKQVVCGSTFTAAIKTDGTLWTWGSNSFAQLGNNDALGVTRSTPITTFLGGSNWKQVSTGNVHIAAIKNDGTLWTWGFGGSGQLGNNESNNVRSPVTTFLGGNDWKQVDCGINYTSAVKTNGTLWCWGDGGSGRLGTNNAISRSTPVTTFAGGNNWKQVACGNANTAAVKTNGTLWTWGSGNNGKLGTNNTTDRSTPVTTFAGGTNWKQVSCADNHTSVITYIDDYQ